MERSINDIMDIATSDLLKESIDEEKFSMLDGVLSPKWRNVHTPSKYIDYVDSSDELYEEGKGRLREWFMDHRIELEKRLKSVDMGIGFKVTWLRMPMQGYKTKAIGYLRLYKLDE